MPMNFDELCQRTRELASNGADFQDVFFDDSMHEPYCELSRSGELDKDKLVRKVSVKQTAEKAVRTKGDW